MKGIQKRAWIGGAASKALSSSVGKGVAAGTLGGAATGAATSEEDESTLGSAAKGALGGAMLGGAAGKGVSKMKSMDDFEIPSMEMPSVTDVAGEAATQATVGDDLAEGDDQ